MQTNHPFLLVGRSDNVEAFSVNHPIGYALETIAGEPCPGNEPNDAMASVLGSASGHNYARPSQNDVGVGQSAPAQW